MKNYFMFFLIISISVSTILPASARQEVLASDSGWIKRFDASTGDYIGKFSGGGAIITAGADGILYMGGGRDIGRINMATGEHLSNFSGMQSGLSGSKGMAMASDGKLYVSDTYNNRILRFDTATGASEVVSLSQPVVDPRGIAFGLDGDLYVCSYIGDGPQYGVRRYNGTSGQLVETYLANSNIAVPTSLAFAPNGDLYALNQCAEAICRLNSSTKQFEVFLPWVEDRSWGYTSIAFNEDGTMYIGATGYHDLLTYNCFSATSVPFTSGGNLISAPFSLVVANVVPEPSSLLAVFMGLGAATGMWRRKH